MLLEWVLVVVGMGDVDVVGGGWLVVGCVGAIVWCVGVCVGLPVGV